MAKRPQLSEYAKIFAESVAIMLNMPIGIVETAIRERFPHMCAPGWKMPNELLVSAQKAKTDQNERTALFSSLVKLGAEEYQASGQEPFFVTINRLAKEAQDRKFRRRR